MNSIEMQCEKYNITIRCGLRDTWKRNWYYGTLFTFCI